MNLKKLLALALGIMLGLCALSGCAEDMDAADGVLSAFTAVDIDGNAVDQNVLEGYTLTMVNAWGTYCGPCINEMPYLGELNEEYAQRGFRIIGIVVDAGDTKGNVDEYTVEKAKGIVEQTGASYLHMLPGQGMGALLDGMQYIPTTIFVNEKGEQVGETYVGSMEKDEWAEIIEETLALAEGSVNAVG